jgi:hypothetical protein
VSTVTITCPECDKKLRLSKRPDDGKKVKCPACGEAFVPALTDDDAEAVAIRERPRTTSPARRRDDDDAPARSRRRDDDDDDAPVRSRRRQDDDGDEDDGPVRSRRRDDDEDRPARKKKSKQKAGSNMLLYGLLGAGALVLILACGGLGVTGFVWPGFMLSKQKANEVAVAGNNAVAEKPLPPVNLNAYVMPEADLVIGFNVKVLRETNQLPDVLAKFRATQPTGLPRGFEDIAQDSDRVVASLRAAELLAQAGGAFGAPQAPNAPKGGPGPQGGPGPAGPPKVIVAVALSNLEAVGRAKNVIRAVPGMGVEEKLAGKYPAYRYRDPGNGDVTIFAFPSDRVLVITPNSEQQLMPMLDRAAGNTATAAPELTKMSALVEQGQIWGAYVTDAQGRAALGTLSLFLVGQQGVPPAVQAAVQALGKVKGLSIAADGIAGGGSKLQFHMDCDDVDAARRLKEGGDAVKAMMNNQANNPNVSPNVRQDFNTLTFAVQGTVASGSVTISAATMKEIGDKAGGAAGPNQGFQQPQGKAPAGKSQSYNLVNLNSQQAGDRTIEVQAGRKVTVTAVYTAADADTNLDLYVFQGMVQPNAIPAARDEKPANLKARPTRTCTATFVATLNGQYTIRLVNRGPGVVNSVAVTIRED